MKSHMKKYFNDSNMWSLLGLTASFAILALAFIMLVNGEWVMERLVSLVIYSTVIFVFSFMDLVRGFTVQMVYSDLHLNDDALDMLQQYQNNRERAEQIIVDTNITEEEINLINEYRNAKG